MHHSHRTPISERGIWRVFRRLHKAARLMKLPLYREVLLKSRIGATIEHEPVFRGRSYAGVIDIGAHCGQFTTFARATWPDASIFAFEPLSTAYARLHALASDLGGVEAVNAAIHEEDGKFAFFVTHRDDSSSLLQPTALSQDIFPRTAVERKTTVSAGTLSSFIAAERLCSPVLLKIDVQGAERQVINGCLDMIDRIQSIYIEIMFASLYENQASVSEIIATLHQYDFELEGIFNVAMGTQGTPLQADFFFNRSAQPNPLVAA